MQPKMVILQSLNIIFMITRMLIKIENPLEIKRLKTRGHIFLNLVLVSRNYNNYIKIMLDVVTFTLFGSTILLVNLQTKKAGVKSCLKSW